MHPIPVSFGVIGTITTPRTYKQPLPVGTEVIVFVRKGCERTPADWSPLFSRFGYSRPLLEQALSEQYRWEIARDPQILGYLDDQAYYQFYIRTGVALLLQVKTRHATGCSFNPLSDLWNSSHCPRRGCTTEISHHGFPITFVRWHESELASDGRLLMTSGGKRSYCAYYTIAGDPTQYTQADFPGKPGDYEGHSLSQLSQALYDLHGPWPGH